MEFDEFKDIIFDLLNDCDTLIVDIDTKEQENIFTITMVGGNVFEIECRKRDE